MTTPAYTCELEVRASATGVTLTGSFAYGRQATDRREQFAAGSLTVTGQTRLLYSHQPSAVLADEPSGSLTIRQDESGLQFTASLPPEAAMTTQQRDAVSLVRQGLAVGLSPGFAVSREQQRAGTRVIERATLYELSIVPRASYSASASVTMRTADTEAETEREHVL